MGVRPKILHNFKDWPQKNRRMNKIPPVSKKVIVTTKAFIFLTSDTCAQASFKLSAFNFWPNNYLMLIA